MTTPTEDITVIPYKQSVAKRIDYLDVAKGLTILLVIVSHTFTVWNIKVNWIFTFHMPLFFILSGYFFKSGSKTNCIKLFKALILPYLSLNLLKLGINICANADGLNIRDRLLGIFYGNSVKSAVKLCLIKAPTISITWFLLALFWCRIIYSELDSLSKKYGFSVLLITAISAYAMTELKEYVCLPFSLMSGITAMIFYHMGRVIKEKNIFDLKLKDISPLLIILSLVVWECCCVYGKLRINGSVIKLLTDIPTAAIGTFYIVKLSKVILKMPLAGSFFKWCGKHSIVIFGVHSFDDIIMYEIFKVLPNFNKINSWEEYFLYLLIRIGSIVVTAFIYVAMKNTVNYMIQSRKTKHNLQM